MAESIAKKGDACCSALDAVLTADEFEPTITVDDDGVLCLTVGITDIEEEEPTLVLEPMIFCPFCGTRLQSGETTGGSGIDADGA
ncbi:MAG: hypothetical protein SFW09_12260 [Hyphomicrobiaceae bacterium]|nr:hypothetical protein [Hyphomicrobiaceae bacterium]